MRHPVSSMVTMIDIKQILQSQGTDMSLPHYFSMLYSLDRTNDGENCHIMEIGRLRSFWPYAFYHPLRRSIMNYVVKDMN